MIRINFYLSKTQVNRLRRLSWLTGISSSEHLRRLLDRYLEEELEKAENYKSDVKGDKK